MTSAKKVSELKIRETDGKRSFSFKDGRHQLQTESSRFRHFVINHKAEITSYPVRVVMSILLDEAEVSINGELVHETRSLRKLFSILIQCYNAVAIYAKAQSCYLGLTRNDRLSESRRLFVEKGTVAIVEFMLGEETRSLMEHEFLKSTDQYKLIAQKSVPAKRTISESNGNKGTPQIERDKTHKKICVATNIGIQ